MLVVHETFKGEQRNKDYQDSMEAQDISSFLCADCSAKDPQWVSMNHCTFLCDDCAYLHRCLGPTCSRIKHWRNEEWHPKRRELVLMLGKSSANNIWEHSLLDSSKFNANVRKPCCTDSLETKRKFVLSKHGKFQFICLSRDPFDVRNQELHSTVRTNILDTTLRLLAGGADPNYYHQVKGTRPLHVAAKNGQDLQVELLVLFGAMVSGCDYLGQTAVSHALSAGHKQLAVRLLQLKHEVTDTFSEFVYGKVPDHQNSNHLFIPNFNFDSEKLDTLKNFQPAVLEEFCQDIYDELERRRNEKSLSDVLLKESKRLSVSYLPAGEEYPPIRNQARNMLSRLNNRDLKSLVSLTLLECKRRNTGKSVNESEHDLLLSMEKTSSDFEKGPMSLEDDDYPLYDRVPSDENVVLTEQKAIIPSRTAEFAETMPNQLNINSVFSPEKCHTASQPSCSRESEYIRTIQDLQERNEALQQEINVLYKIVSKNALENQALKSKLFLGGSSSSNDNPVCDPCCFENGGTHLQQSRPSSLPEQMSSPVEEQNLLKAKSSIVEFKQETQNIELFPYPEFSNLVSVTTKKIVGLIKDLIIKAESCHYDGVIEKATAIRFEADNLVLKVMLMGAVPTFVQNKLQLFEVQAIKTLNELSTVCENLKTSSSLNSPSLVDVAKSSCMSLGRILRQLSCIR